MERRTILSICMLIILLAVTGLGWYYSDEIPYMLSGWQPLVEGITPQMVVVSDAGALVFVDYEAHTLYAYPHGALEPENYKSYPIELEDPQSPCFFDHDSKLLFPHGTVTILDLESGKYEPVPALQEGYDCESTGEGGVIVGAYGMLAVYSEGDWAIFEDEVLGVPFQVAEDSDGSIWVGTYNEEFYLFDRHMQTFEKKAVMQGPPIRWSSAHGSWIYYELVGDMDWYQYTWGDYSITELAALPNHEFLIDFYGDLAEGHLENGTMVVTLLPDLMEYYPAGEFFFQADTLDRTTGRIWEGYGAYWRTFLPEDDEVLKDHLWPYGFLTHIAIDAQHQVLYAGARAFGDDPGGIYYREVGEVGP